MKRVTILKAVLKGLKANKYNFLCVGIKVELKEKCNIKYSVNDTYIQEIFPQFNREIAIKKFNAIPHLSWWSSCNEEDNLNNRIAFMNYLIEFYKDDRTNIKKKFKNYLDK